MSTVLLSQLTWIYDLGKTIDSDKRWAIQKCINWGVCVCAEEQLQHSKLHCIGLLQTASCTLQIEHCTFRTLQTTSCAHIATHAMSSFWDLGPNKYIIAKAAQQCTALHWGLLHTERGREREDDRYYQSCHKNSIKCFNWGACVCATEQLQYSKLHWVGLFHIVCTLHITHYRPHLAHFTLLPHIAHCTLYVLHCTGVCCTESHRKHDRYYQSCHKNSTFSKETNTKRVQRNFHEGQNRRANTQTEDFLILHLGLCLFFNLFRFHNIFKYIKYWISNNQYQIINIK